MTPSNATNSASTAAATTAVAAATPGGCLVDLPEDSTILFWELIAAITSIAMLGVYFRSWQRAVHRRPLYTVRGTMKQVRRAWVAAHIGKGMLPVNTLRDIIGSSQWFASSALLVAVGAAGFLAQSPVRDGLLQFKVISLVGSQGLTFIFFMHATRYYSHVSILINTPDIGGALVTEEVVYRMVARAATMWSLGMKMQISISLPLLAWVLGPPYLVLATVLVIFTLRQLDFEADLAEVSESIGGGDRSLSTTAPSDMVLLRVADGGHPMSNRSAGEVAGGG